MELVIWHGYLLEGTGSNIYTRHVAQAWGALGHRVRVLCQDAAAGRGGLGENVELLRPEIGALLPVFVVDRYPEHEARHVADMSAKELEAYEQANVRALREALAARPGAFVLANHAIMGAPVARAGCAPSRTPFGVKVHGSELEYAIRGRPRLAGLARPGLDAASAVYVGSEHIARATREVIGPGAYEQRLRRVPPGVDVHAFAPERGSRELLLALLAEAGGAARAVAERHPDPDAAERLARLRGPFVLYVGKLIREKGVHLLLSAWRAVAPRHRETTLVVVGFGSDRAELEGLAGERVLFTGPMDHPQLQRLLPLADVLVVPSVLPEAFGMVAVEAAACGVVPLVAAHSGLAEVADGLGEASRRFDGTVADLEAKLDELLSLPARERRSLGRRAREVAVERWSWEGIARRLLAGAGLDA